MRSRAGASAMLSGLLRRLARGPSAAELPHMVEDAVTSVQGVRDVKVNLIWDPPWDPSRMSDEARVVLNMW